MVEKVKKINASAKQQSVTLAQAFIVLQCSAGVETHANLQNTEEASNKMV
jgi:hypothetical protein